MIEYRKIRALDSAPAVVCAVLVMLAPMARAQDGAYEHERAHLYIGAFITDVDTETRLDSIRGPGTDIDWESDFGLETSMTVVRIGGNFWIKPRQRLDFALFDFSRSARGRIDETIDFGDETFPINTDVDSRFDTTIIKADYTFAALTRPRGYFGVTGGLYVAASEQLLVSQSILVSEAVDLTAPLPVVGLRGEYRLSDRITLYGASLWFLIDTGEISGRLRDFVVGADYRFGERFDLGIGYNAASMNIAAEASGGRVNHFDWRYGGWLLYLQAHFGSGAGD